MMHFQDANQLKRSFQEFTKQPENAALAEQAQREEVQAALDAQEAALSDEVRHKLSCTDEGTRKALGPFLQYRPLLRLVSSLFNDPATDVSAWASNPVVLKMLRRARQMLQEGTVGEQELEQALLKFIKHPTNPHKAEFEQRVASCGVVVTPEQLSAAMNEQLEERQAGNRAYTAGDPQTALHHYSRALAILRLLQPDNSADQQIIREAQSALLLNSAAAHLATCAYGACIEACSAVLSYDEANVTAHLRRARAHMMRREYQAAEEDLRAAESLSDGSRDQELRNLHSELRTIRLRDRKTDKSVYGRMFKA
ncbi:hypothetical protein PLESTF_001560000 [Pleodorina starrii]|nr:hypothetical protein PLESTM_001685700 [Pleodorina starrii]GLC74824.1 hypothetical protein PLESTF_001560000 [Pleodorina starrii]